MGEANGGPAITRNHIFAFDVTTGHISDSFVPELDGKVESVQPAPDGLSVFIGGYFDTVNGATHKRVARVYLSNGQNVPGFNANVTSGKLAMDMSNPDGIKLYPRGPVQQDRYHERRRLRGAQRRHRCRRPASELRFRRQPERRPDADPAHGHLPSRLTVVAIGNFATVNGLDFRQIVKLNVGSRPATIAEWAVNRYKSVCASKFDSYMRDAAIASYGTYFVVATPAPSWGRPAPASCATR